MTCSIYCLTLEHHKQRHKEILEAWEGFDIQFVNGKNYQDIPFGSGSRLFALACCLAGHIDIWRKVEQSNGWSLIIEDDAIPTLNLQQAIKQVEEQDEFNVVKLHHFTTRKVNGIHQLNPVREWVSSVGYMVKDTRLLLNRLWLASPDRMIAGGRVAGYFPVAILHKESASTMPLTWG